METSKIKRDRYKKVKKTLTKKDLTEALKGQWISRGKDATAFSNVGTDTRKSLKGQLFFALKGPLFDGHDFLLQAEEKGAALLVASDEKKIQSFMEKSQNSSGVFQVENTLKALQKLALFWRKKLNLKVICLTGSNGKTTTKKFTETLMSSLPVSSSPKSFNNHWGVPLSLLAVKEVHSFFIQEIGANQKGEIGPLTALCEPSVAAVTTVSPAHLEGFGDMKTLAEEKQQIYEKSPKAQWVFNQDNPFTREMFKKFKSRGDKKPFTFSHTNKKADVSLSISEERRKEMDIEGLIGGVSGRSRIFISGACHLENLMCAGSVALACGVSAKEIWQKLPLCRTPPGRQNWFEWKEREISILFDSYNANPLSMEAFLQKCHKSKTQSERLVFILGDMKELGKESKKYHRNLGESPYIKTADFIWYIGEYGEEVEEALKTGTFQGEFIKSKSYEKTSLLKLKDYLKPHDILGIKASRSLRLEQALFDLTGEKVF